MWDGSQWVTNARGEVVPGVVLAFKDEFIEGTITYEALGSPRPNDDGELYFGWVIVTTQRENHDYAPDTIDGLAYFSIRTAVAPSTWGQVKDGPR